MGALLWLSDKKRAFPGLFAKVLKPITAVAVGTTLTLTGLQQQVPPPYWQAHFAWAPYNFVRPLVSATTTAALVLIVINAILPLAAYIPHAVAMRSMGLLEARVRKGSTRNFADQCVRRYLRYHNDGEPIRIICISGRDLFVDYSADFQAPLRAFAEKGHLHVLFPRSDPSNSTVMERYATYSDAFRASNYPTIEDLVLEIKRSKDFLTRNGDNKAWEHDVLCMWRVVLLSDHCIVQNYFPNRSGCNSDMSPIFVFEKEADCIFSYYDTFEQMFTLLSKPHP